MLSGTGSGFEQGLISISIKSTNAHPEKYMRKCCHVTQPVYFFTLSATAIHTA